MNDKKKQYRTKFIEDWSRQLAQWSGNYPDTSAELIVSRIMDAALQHKEKLDIGYKEDYELKN